MHLYGGDAEESHETKVGESRNRSSNVKTDSEMSSLPAANFRAQDNASESKSSVLSSKENDSGGLVKLLDTLESLDPKLHRFLVSSSRNAESIANNLSDTRQTGVIGNFVSSLPHPPVQDMAKNVTRNSFPGDGSSLPYGGSLQLVSTGMSPSNSFELASSGRLGECNNLSKQGFTDMDLRYALNRYGLAKPVEYIGLDNTHKTTRQHSVSKLDIELLASMVDKLNNSPNSKLDLASVQVEHDSEMAKMHLDIANDQTRPMRGRSTSVCSNASSNARLKREAQSSSKSMSRLEKKSSLDGYSASANVNNSIQRSYSATSSGGNLDDSPNELESSEQLESIVDSSIETAKLMKRRENDSELSQRERKKEREKKRRSEVNIMFGRLSDCLDLPKNARMGKIALLNAAVEHVKKLKIEVENLQSSTRQDKEMREQTIPFIVANHHLRILSESRVQEQR